MSHWIDFTDSLNLAQKMCLSPMPPNLCNFNLRMDQMGLMAPPQSTSLFIRPGSSCSSNSNGSETPVNPPIHNKNYQESRYKTELCRHFEENGVCPHSLQCLFAHGAQELKPFRGRHKKFKTQLCKAFHRDGFCSFGPRCSYIHSDNDVIAEPNGALTVAKQRLVSVTNDVDNTNAGTYKDINGLGYDWSAKAPAVPVNNCRLSVFTKFANH